MCCLLSANMLQPPAKAGAAPLGQAVLAPVHGHVAPTPVASLCSSNSSLAHTSCSAATSVARGHNTVRCFSSKQDTATRSLPEPTPAATQQQRPNLQSRYRLNQQLPKRIEKYLGVRKSESPAPLFGQSDLPFRFFVTCHPGLEQVVAAELEALGLQQLETRTAGVSFRGASLADGYRANIGLRSAIRVLVLLAEGDLGIDVASGRRAADAIYEFVRTCAPWHQLIPKGATFSVDPKIISCTDLTSRKFLWSRIKDAICDDIRDQRNGQKPPPPDGPHGDVPIHAIVREDKLVLYRDMSGASLHRRGYRDVMHKASLNESAAAGILRLAGWHDHCQQEGVVLADPMCGSGTFLIEAALMARNIAPGLMRDTSSWPFTSWPDHDPAAFVECVREAKARIKKWDGVIMGLDKHKGALSIASKDVETANLAKLIRLEQGDCGSWRPKPRPTMVVCNPPWGMRLMSGQQGHLQQPHDAAQPRLQLRSGRSAPPLSLDGGEEASSLEELQAAWKSLDTFLATQCQGASAHVLSGAEDNFRHIWMKPNKKHSLGMGGLTEVKLYSYQIFNKQKEGQSVGTQS